MKLIISPSPHIHSKTDTLSLMKSVMFALYPAVGVAVWFYGWSVLLTIVICILTCDATEILCNKFLLKKNCPMDPSPGVTGMLLALNLPPTAPWYLCVIGSIVAIGIGKMTFGGLGQNIFNPALLGRVFLLISFPVAMTDWSLTQTAMEFSAFGIGPKIDAFTGATDLALAKLGTPNAFTWDMALIRVGGSIGELSAVALTIGFLYLLARGVVKITIPASIIITVAIISGIFHTIDPQTYTGPLFNIFTGGLLLGAYFMATDYVTSPMTTMGQIIFGVGIGVIIIMIRYFGSYPEGTSFAILIMNCVVPLIDKYTQSRRFAKEAHNG